MPGGVGRSPARTCLPPLQLLLLVLQRGVQRLQVLLEGVPVRRQRRAHVLQGRGLELLLVKACAVVVRARRAGSGREAVSED